MTTSTTTTLPNGDIHEVRTNPGAPPITYINGILQSSNNWAFTTPTEPWQPWFAWRPVKVDKRWVWLRELYRREIPRGYVNHDDWTRWEYGTIFDVIRGDE